MQSPPSHNRSSTWATLALTTGGLGFLRPAPGTWGSLPPPLLAGLLGMLDVSVGQQIWTCLALLLGFSIACVYFGAYAERRFGRKDASEVVADETAGVCIPVIAVLWVIPTSQHAAGLLAAFLLFRVFDIIKPWPARRLEKLPLGWGVLLDDLAAGVFSAVVIGLGWVLWST